MSSCGICPGRTWTEAKYTFPGKYDYGSIAVGDLNGDGRPDLALAQHAGNIALLLNDGGNNFTESPLATEEPFHSRGIVLSDINSDGRPDIIAASEAKFSGQYIPRGILVAINQEGKSWDVSILEDNSGLFADSIATGDIRGGGDKDIAVAFLTSMKEIQKLIWFGDGKGGFQPYAGDILADISGQAVPALVRTGNVDGDVEDEVAFGLALIGRANEKGKLVVLKWTGEGFSDISSGLDLDGYLVSFDLADIDGDGRNELVVLTETGLHIFRYNSPAGWREQGHVSIPAGDIPNVTDLKVGKNKDGSVVIVYNLGKYETPGFNQGIKAYVLNRKGLH